MRLWILASISFGLIATASAPAAAGVVNFGMNVASNGTGTQVDFFQGDNVGRRVDEDHSIDLTLDTMGLNSAGPTWDWTGRMITSFYFFIDADGVSGSEEFSLQVRDGLYWRTVGQLANNGGSNTFIPARDGGRRVSGTPGDDDNTFVSETDTLAYDLFDDIAAGTFRFRVRAEDDHDEARIDGVNLQVSFSEPQPAARAVGDVQGSASLLLLGLGALRATFRRQVNDPTVRQAVPTSD